jgi:hypothetical protein
MDILEMVTWMKHVAEGVKYSCGEGIELELFYNFLPRDEIL